MDLLHGYVGFEEYWAARPLSRIVRVDIGSGAAETVFEEEYWIGHTNTSPTMPNLMTFATKVPGTGWTTASGASTSKAATPGRYDQDRRERQLATSTGSPTGMRIGYHGYGLNGEHFYGSIRHDNTDRVEAPFPHGSTHFHSNDLSLIVGDGSRDAPRLSALAIQGWALRWTAGRAHAQGLRSTRRFCTSTLASHPTETRYYSRATRADTATYTSSTRRTSTHCPGAGTRER